MGVGREDFRGLHAEVTDRVIKVFYSVANELGDGFMETVYRRAMAFGLEDAGLRVQQEMPVPVSFRGRVAGTFYADLVVNDLVILELKVADQVTRQHEAQLVHYLKATRVEVGLVLAFATRATFRRVIMTNDRKPGLAPL